MRLSPQGLLVAAVAILGAVGFAGRADAAVSYSYTTDASSYVAPVGSTVNVKLYLLEQLTAGSTSIINPDGGMLGVGLKVTRAGGAPANPATLGTVTLNTADFGGPTSKTEGAAGFQFLEAIASGSPPPPGVPTGNSGGNAANVLANAVYLGSVAVTVGSDLTTFNLQPYDNLGGNTLTLNNFYDLDFSSNAPAFIGASANPTSFTVGVPEPTFAGIAVIIGAASTMIRRRRSV